MDTTLLCASSRFVTSQYYNKADAFGRRLSSFSSCKLLYSNSILTRNAGTKSTRRAIVSSVMGRKVKKETIIPDPDYRFPVAFLARRSRDDSNDAPVWLSDDSPFVVVTDPLDGSRNIDASIPTGTIFGVYKQLEEIDHLPKEEKAMLNSLQRNMELELKVERWWHSIGGAKHQSLGLRYNVQVVYVDVELHKKPTAHHMLELEPRIGLDLPEYRINGLVAVAVAAIPTMKFNCEAFSSTENTQCAICLSEYQEKEVLRMMPKCGHRLDSLFP